jgi:hypothetical protein
MKGTFLQEELAIVVELAEIHTYFDCKFAEAAHLGNVLMISSNLPRRSDFGSPLDRENTYQVSSLESCPRSCGRGEGPAKPAPIPEANHLELKAE